MFNLDKKQFVVVDNEHGLSSQDTIFRYYQDGEIVTGDYSGGEIEQGRFVGKYVKTNRIDLLFQCITCSGELLSGEAKGSVDSDDAGLLRLVFDWRWLSGAHGNGISSYIERRDKNTA